MTPDDWRKMQDSQRLYNYYVSQIVQTIALQTIALRPSLRVSWSRLLLRLIRVAFSDHCRALGLVT